MSINTSGVVNIAQVNLAAPPAAAATAGGAVAGAAAAAATAAPAIATDNVAINAAQAVPLNVNLEVLPDPVDPELQAAFKQAEIQKKNADQALGTDVTGFNTQITQLQALSQQLDLPGGGEVEKIGGGRAQRFNSELSNLTTLMSQHPVPAAQIGRDIANMKAMLEPQGTANQTFWGNAVPGDGAAMAALDSLGTAAKGLGSAQLSATTANDKLSFMKTIVDNPGGGIPPTPGLNQSGHDAGFGSGPGRAEGRRAEHAPGAATATTERDKATPGSARQAFDRHDQHPEPGASGAAERPHADGTAGV